MRRCLLVIIPLVILVVGLGVRSRADGELERGFHTPPDSARPWVYWFWLNGNVTRDGITADLEAMRRVGIGGVLIMEVDQGAPLGPVPFAGPRWRDLFKFVVSEAHRLGLQVNMNDDAGWAGSGGPWVTPDRAMQKLVWTETAVEGPRRFAGVLPQPQAVAGFYRDVSVLAFPTPSDYRIPNIDGKAAFVREDYPAPSTYAPVSSDRTIPRSEIRELTATMASDGRIAWDVPAGRWTLLRLGYTPTGAMNEPSPQSGLGLECDKLSPEGSEAAFNGLIAKLASDVGTLAGSTFVRTHIDSWEVHSQNWTARFREEFRRRRGYDLLAYLPVMTGRVVDSAEVSERFLWDLRQTVSELLVENYAGHMSDLARRRGLRLSIEAYGDGVFDDMAYAGRADEPMAEFWSSPANFMGVVQEMASAGHVYGKPIVGAEAFTADQDERWLFTPGSVKPLGDWAFCRGINRFVIHRYAMQPWLDRKPGMSMGPWGLHYERTQTWWSYAQPWHRYLARCQYMLRQGLPVADILYLSPEGAPRDFQLSTAQMRSGYGADGCPAEIVLRRLQVRDGRLHLPGGMSYRALVLPPSQTMTVELLRRIKALANAGATIIGTAPTASPSLADYPACDREVQSIASSLWASGKIVAGKTAEQVLAGRGVPPDFTSDRQLDYVHRRSGATDIYFVANGGGHPMNATCSFRSGGKAPELWDPETGRIEPIPMYTSGQQTTRLMLRLEAAGSAFVVFRAATRPIDPVVGLSRAGQVLWPIPTTAPRIDIVRALWGPPGDEQRTKDVTEQVRRIVQSGTRSFLVADLAAEGDPAFRVLKTLRVDYLLGGQRLTASAIDSANISFEWPSDPRIPIRVLSLSGRRLTAELGQPGDYAIKTRSGRTSHLRVAKSMPTVDLRGPWALSFPPQSGAPARVALDRLSSWSESADTGVKYFSGTATYSTNFTVPAEILRADRRLYLDLGRVEVMAQPSVNGTALPILWKTPFVTEVTGVIRPGKNTLAVRVVNLWPNRMIGDEQLPEDSARNPGGTLREWPTWLQQGKPSPSGRFTFTSWRLWSKDSTLLPSGLLGPVTLRTTSVVSIPRP